MGFDKETVLAATDIPSLMRELLPELHKVGGSGDQVLVNCVYHEDQTPSLSVKLSTGLHNCKACGAKGGPVDLVMKVHGLEFSAAVRWLADRAGLQEEQQEKPKFKVTGHYAYQRADGSLAYWKERIEPGVNQGKNGKRRSKSFLFCHNPAGRDPIKPGQGFFQTKEPDENGKLQKPYSGLGGSEHLPYRLPDLVKAAPGSMVFVPEGEKKCDLLASWLLLATCLDAGGESGVYASFVNALAGHHVVILPDNDKTGEDYANKVAVALHGVAASIRVLRLPGLAEKGDILDWAGKK